MNSKIIILLPVHNRIEITRKFLECLINQTYQNYHLILIDDGCADGTAEMAESIIKNITILKGNGNLWWAGSLQLAYNYLKTSVDFSDDDIVLIINDDVFIEKEYLEIAVKIFAKNENKKMLLPSIAVNNLNGEICPAGVYYDNKKFTFTPTNEEEKINCLSTRGLFLRLIDFLSSGGFYPKLLPHYFSDYEFTIRMIKNNNEVHINNALVLQAYFEYSGIRVISENVSSLNYVKSFFSKKNISNPVYVWMFIFMTTTFPFNVLNSLKTAKNIVRGFIRFVIKRAMKYSKTRINWFFIMLSILLWKNKIIVGSGSSSYKGWVSTDIETLNIVSEKDWKFLLPFRKLKAVLMEHVLEHLTEDDAKKGLENIFKYLKKGGYVRIAVPDGFHPALEYIENVKPGGTGAGAEDHKVLYNYKSLTKIMNECGFECNLLEYWDERGQFHYKHWNPEDGMIMRSLRFDKRNVEGEPIYTSLIIDGYKKV